MAYPYTIKVDKNKITVGMARRLKSGDIDAVVDLIAALSLDDNGVKPEREKVLQVMEDVSMEELDSLVEALMDEFSTPKES